MRHRYSLRQELFCSGDRISEKGLMRLFTRLRNGRDRFDGFTSCEEAA